MAAYSGRRKCALYCSQIRSLYRFFSMDKQPFFPLLSAVCTGMNFQGLHRQVDLKLGRRALTYSGSARQPVRAGHPVAAARVPAQVQEVAAGTWHALLWPSIWQGSEAEALNSSNSCFQCLAPPWKVLLLSDGSVTRHLQLMTGEVVKAECLEMVNVGSSTEGLPPGVDQIPGPRVQRQVLLRPVRSSATGTNGTQQEEQHTTAQQQLYSSQQVQPQAFNSTSGSSSHTSTSSGSSLPPPLVYACSWWAAAEVDQFLKDRSQTIWASLSQGHVELYREVQSVYYGHNAQIEELLGVKGPLWGRHYFFWHQGRPLTLIYEVFSSRLAEYLGPMENS